MLPDTAPDRVAVGDAVLLHPTPDFAPADSWIGRVIDPFGAPLDGRPMMRGEATRDLMAAPPKAASRRPMGERLATGLAVFNTILPIVKGQRVGLFAGSGVGKSTLLATLAQNMEADVVVIALIGERGREVNHFVKDVLGDEGMQRAVVVAATSDQSALVRRRCAWSAMAVAEHFRDQGKNVLFLADSVTRFAEAHREIAVSSGEAPALRGYPPSVTPLITGLCERAGPGSGDQGDITAIFSVLVAGSDMSSSPPGPACRCVLCLIWWTTLPRVRARISSKAPPPLMFRGLSGGWMSNALHCVFPSPGKNAAISSTDMSRYNASWVSGARSPTAWSRIWAASGGA